MKNIFLCLCCFCLNVAFAGNISTDNIEIGFPDRLGSLFAGRSNYSEVIDLFGRPETEENFVSKWTGEELLDLRYPKLGVDFTIQKNKQMRVARIEIYKPFSGRSSDGMYIGMPFNQAREIFERKYGKPSIVLNGYVDWNAPNVVAIKYESGAVTAFKMLGLLPKQ